MNKTKNIVWFLSVLILCGLSISLNFLSRKPKTVETPKPQPEYNYVPHKTHKTGFSDGLDTPDSTTTYTPDEFGEGITEKSVYYIDINGDGLLDRITRKLFSTASAHSYYEYNIELKQDDKYVDITPYNFRTINGADCDLQRIQFSFKPQFKITLIYREMGDTWNQPTMANKKTFKLSNNKIKEINEKQMQPICDVKDLF